MKPEMEADRAEHLNNLFKNGKREAHFGDILKKENNVDFITATTNFKHEQHVQRVCLRGQSTRPYLQPRQPGFPHNAASGPRVPETACTVPTQGLDKTLGLADTAQ